MIRIENPDEIYEWEIEKLWNTIKTYEDEETERGKIKKIYKKEIETIKNGINLKIPIWYLIKGWYIEYPNTKRVQVKGHGKVNIIEFMEEKERRENILRTIILENLEENTATEPR